VPLIALAHEIPYVATGTVAEPRDLEAKVERAMELRGARYIHVFVPCPLGWGSASRDTIRLARLVKETGLFPVFEAERGEVVSVSKIRRRVPVEEYLTLQRRYAHLFGDNGRPDVVARLQAAADRNVERFGLLAEGDQRSELPGVAEDVAGESLDDPLRPVDTEAESNLMRLLSETHGSPR
jgi:pyruvate ferredoxin oxidoreductase beta subunit